MCQICTPKVFENSVAQGIQRFPNTHTKGFRTISGSYTVEVQSSVINSVAISGWPRDRWASLRHETHYVYLDTYRVSGVRFRRERRHTFHSLISFVSINGLLQ